MSTEAWRPLDEREAGAAAPEPVLLDGVPDHLDDPLRRWLASFVESGSLAQRVALRLRITAQNGETLRMTLSYYTEANQLLQAIDAALYFQPHGMSLAGNGRPANASGRQALLDYFLRPASTLSTILLDGGSAWQVAPNGRSLQRRVDATVQGAHTAATSAASASGRPEAARDLTDAWAKVYGTHPDPSEAYRLAIRAVEDVAIPLTIPQDKNATLGKVRAHLTNAAAKWHLSMTSDVEPLVVMISLLWTGQTDRHAGQVDLTRVDQKAAEQAVHLATTLVQWFAAGHVQRVP